MSGILEGLFSKALWDGMKAGVQSLSSAKIQITSPRPLEPLTGAEQLGTMQVFTIRGTLKRLPKEYEIWLLLEEPSGRIWPQGFYNVQFNPDTGAWMGKINGAGCKEVKIVAVVSPPTSQDYFRYFQTTGVSGGYHFEPLKRIPPECRNQASVQAFIP